MLHTRKILRHQRRACDLLAECAQSRATRRHRAYLDSVNAKVVDFARFEVGEGIEKASNDFENEVAATMAAALNK